jgi:FKBP-type peptidyl-prolyl cis-trans isomerase
MGQVIRGWDIAIPKLSKGQHVRLTVSSQLGYGEQGFPPIIQPNQTLVYEIELLGFWSENMTKAP